MNLAISKFFGCFRRDFDLCRLPAPKNLFYFRRPNSVPNFGDDISPLVVRRMLQLGRNFSSTDSKNSLLAVGSILHFAQTDDVIWGSGINGKVSENLHTFENLDVRSVRGPFTRSFLEAKGISCPEIYGDPALLMSHFYKKSIFRRRNTRPFIVIPNYNDLSLFSEDLPLVYPSAHYYSVITEIVNSKLVVSSSLHGIILAETYGVPAILLLPKGHAESLLKYRDYYEGTGRDDFPICDNINAALNATTTCLPMSFDFDSLKQAFPSDLYSDSCTATNSYRADEGSGEEVG